MKTALEEANEELAARRCQICGGPMHFGFCENQPAQPKEGGLMTKPCYLCLASMVIGGALVLVGYAVRANG